MGIRNWALEIGHWEMIVEEVKGVHVENPFNIPITYYLLPITYSLP